MAGSKNTIKTWTSLDAHDIGPGSSTFIPMYTLSSYIEARAVEVKTWTSLDAGTFG